MDFGVVITAYNCERFIENTLSSVFSQTLTPKEVVVVDDNSRDRTYQILQRLKSKYKNLKVLRNEKNLERSLSRNGGAEALSTDIVCFLDCDDLWGENYLEEVSKLFQDGADFTFGLPEGFIDERGKLIRRKEVKETFEELLFSGKVGYPSGSCFKRKPFLEEGGYSNLFLFREDWEILLRLYLKGYKIGFKPNLPYLIREHRNRTSRGNKKFLEATLKVYGAYKDKIPPEYKALFLHHIAVQCLRFDEKGCAVKFLKSGGWKALKRGKALWEIVKRLF